MSLPIILIEGASATEYVRSTVSLSEPLLSAHTDKIHDGGGINELDARLGKLIAAGRGDSVFVVWDGDLLGRAGPLNLRHVIDHPHSVTLVPDFEEQFPDWMVAGALRSYDKETAYPDADQIRGSCRIKGASEPFYDRLKKCAREKAAQSGDDPSSIVLPEKVQLANCPASVANQTWHQPESIRRALRRVCEFLGVSQSDSLIETGHSTGAYELNTELVTAEGLSGRIAMTVLPDLWVMDLDSGQAQCVQAGCAVGEPCWSPDGTEIAFATPHSSEQAVRLYEPHTGQSRDVLRIGPYVCWGKEKLLYGQAADWRIQSVNRLGGNRRVLNLPQGSILAAVDRNKDRRSKPQKKRSSTLRPYLSH